MERGAHLIADAPNTFKRKRADVDMVERVEELRFHDQEPGAGVRENMLKLQTARGNIDRDYDRAEPGTTAINLEEIGAI